MRPAATVLRAALALLVTAAATSAAAAEVTHTLAPGETLSGLATQLYGASWKAVYLTARNGLASERDVPAGVRLTVPACVLYKVRRGETLAEIAKRWLGDRDRFKVLAQENGIKDAAGLEVGAELLIPFVLRHTAEPGDSWSRIAQRYYRNTHRATLVKEYNPTVTALSPGDKVFVPIFDRATVDAASRRPAAAKAAPPAAAKPAAPAKTPAPATAKTEPGKTTATGARAPAAATPAHASTTPAAQKPAPATPTPPAAPGAAAPGAATTLATASAVAPSGPAATPTAGPTPGAAAPAPGAASAATQPAGATPAGAPTAPSVTVTSPPVLATLSSGAPPESAPRPPTPPHSAAVDVVRGLSPTALHTLVLRAVDEYKRGEFEVACGKLEAALGAEVLPLPDRVTTVSHLGFCAVAAGDRGAAVDYFQKWLELDPRAELDPVTTSPKILVVFQEVAESVRGELNEPH